MEKFAWILTALLLCGCLGVEESVEYPTGRVIVCSQKAPKDISIEGYKEADWNLATELYTPFQIRSTAIIPGMPAAAMAFGIPEFWPYVATTLVQHDKEYLYIGMIIPESGISESFSRMFNMNIPSIEPNGFKIYFDSDNDEKLSRSDFGIGVFLNNSSIVKEDYMHLSGGWVISNNTKNWSCNLKHIEKTQIEVGKNIYMFRIPLSEFDGNPFGVCFELTIEDEDSDCYPVRGHAQDSKEYATAYLKIVV